MTPSELKALEQKLWSAADDMRANSGLKASEYAAPILGLIFLRFADNKYHQHAATIAAEFQRLQGGRRKRTIEAIALEKCGFFLPDEARYQALLDLPDGADIAAAIKQAMQSIEDSVPNDQLKDVLPKDEYS